MRLVREHFVEGSRDADFGISLLRVVGVALENAGQFHSLDAANHWRMKCLSRQAKSD